MSKLILGFAEAGPRDGMGPWSAIYDKGRALRYETSLQGIDALILWGGSDISPSLYGETPIQNSGPPRPSERDLFEWELLNQAVANKIPIIGVCRGAQLMCAYVGGKLVQNVNNHVAHQGGRHEVVTYDGQVFNSTSCHHQMMWPYDVEHKLLAWTIAGSEATVYQPENTYAAAAYEKRQFKEPEAVYFPSINGFAVQGHPEWQEGSAYAEWLLEEYLQHCFTRVEC